MPEHLRDAYHRLLAADVATVLPGEPLTPFATVRPEEIRQLVGVASAMALSDHVDDRTEAYEIATRVLSVDSANSANLTMASEMLLARLGNFPGIELLATRRSKASVQDPSRMPTYLGLEAAIRRIENSIEIGDARMRVLTDFQCDFLSALDTYRVASVSAPTSAGKTFVFALAIANALRQATRPKGIVCIVPTRALMRQVVLGLMAVLADYGLVDIPVRCVPIPISKEDAPRGAVYVLTQERLLSMLYADDGKPWIDALYVDEAQCIGDDQRGVLLETVLGLTLERFPRARVYFASPLAANPDYLLSLFEKTRGGHHFTEMHSPVTQNMVLVSPRKGKPEEAAFELLLKDSPVKLGTQRLPFSLNGPVYQARARFAVAVTKPDDCTILYADEPRAARRTAAALLSELEEVDENPSPSPAIAELMDFVQTYIHPEYELVPALRHRVAFHCGHMPSIVRSRIERLAEQGELRFICCTSTLLQGVNLPAHNIVIEDPKKGRHKTMNRASFLNLAGRAGRLLQEFQGNVWCLRPNKWAEKSYKGERLQPLSSAFVEALVDGGRVVQEVLDGKAGREDKELGIAVLSKLYSDYVKPQHPLPAAILARTENRGLLERTCQNCAEIVCDLSDELLRKHTNLDPRLLGKLAEFLRAKQDLEPLMPLLPRERASNTRLGEILREAGRILEIWHGNSHLYFRWLANAWMHEEALGSIIEQRIGTLKGQGKFTSIGAAVGEVMQGIERGVRFDCVRILRAYEDLLKLVLTERGRRDAADCIPSLHVYLECGASSTSVLSLISIGLSRTTALFLKKAVSFPEEPTPEQCLAKIRQLNVDYLDIPELCKAEVREIRGG